jgi:hypothetical protein
MAFFRRGSSVSSAHGLNSESVLTPDLELSTTPLGRADDTGDPNIIAARGCHQRGPKVWMTPDAAKVDAVAALFANESVVHEPTI